jgi:hypothetical protein
MVLLTYDENRSRLAGEMNHWKVLSDALLKEYRTLFSLRTNVLGDCWVDWDVVSSTLRQIGIVVVLNRYSDKY